MQKSTLRIAIGAALLVPLAGFTTVLVINVPFLSKFAADDLDGGQPLGEMAAGLGSIGGREAYKSAMRTYPADEIPPAVVANARATHQRIALADEQIGAPAANGHTWSFYGPKVA